MADRYRVGGTEDRDGTAGTKWALTSGGAGGEAVPGVGDDVFFDASSGAGTVTKTTSTSMLSLNFTGFTGTFAGTGASTIVNSLTMGSGMTNTYTGTITLSTGTGDVTCNGITLGSAVSQNGSGGNHTLQDTLDMGTRALTLSLGTLNTNGKTVTCGSFSLGSSGVRVLTLGASTINCTRLNNSGTTFLTVNSNTSQINITGTLSSDLASYSWNNITFSGSSNRVPVTGVSINNLIFTSAYTGTVSGSGNMTIRGNLELGANMNRTSTGLTTFTATTTGRTIRCNGISLSNVTFNGTGGGWTMQDAFFSTGLMTLTAGTLNANNQNVTIDAFGSSNSNTRTLTMGGGTRTLNRTSATPRNIATSTNLTLNANTSTIRFAGGSTTSKTFDGGGLTYYNFENATTNTGEVRFTGSNTFNNFKINAGRTTRFTAGTTTTVNTFDAIGTSGSPIVIGSITTAAHNLVKAGGGIIEAEWLQVSYSQASPSTTWYAFNSVNNGDNTGWIFTPPPPAGSGNFIMFMQ